jgi:hypothetical protein
MAIGRWIIAIVVLAIVFYLGAWLGFWNNFHL